MIVLWSGTKMISVHYRKCYRLPWRKYQTGTCVLKNKFDFWNVHGVMNTSGFLRFTLTLQETLSIHDSMNRPKIEFIAYIYILS